MEPEVEVLYLDMRCIKCAIMKTANIGTRLALVAKHNPMNTPARLESRSLPSLATLIMKYMEMIVNVVRRTSDARK